MTCEWMSKREFEDMSKGYWKKSSVAPRITLSAGARHILFFVDNA
jgi:hypothetical protein